MGRGLCFRVYGNDSLPPSIYDNRIWSTPRLKQTLPLFTSQCILQPLVISPLRPPAFSFFNGMGLARSFPPFSLRCGPRGQQSAPFQFPTSEGWAEPRATLTFRSLKMIRSANGCLEPVKFTRLSNHFQTGGTRHRRAVSCEVPQRRGRKRRP